MAVLHAHVQKKQTGEIVIMTNKYSTCDLDLDKSAELRDLEGGAHDCRCVSLIACARPLCGCKRARQAARCERVVSAVSARTAGKHERVRAASA